MALYIENIIAVVLGIPAFFAGIVILGILIVLILDRLTPRIEEDSDIGMTTDEYETTYK